LRQFMSPDNYVQDPYNTQNFNRFTHIFNICFLLVFVNAQHLNMS
jgi:hypothetical protein